MDSPLIASTWASSRLSAAATDLLALVLVGAAEAADEEAADVAAGAEAAADAGA